jgi:hypothetical protein
MTEENIQPDSPADEAPLFVEPVIEPAAIEPAPIEVIEPTPEPMPEPVVVPEPEPEPAPKPVVVQPSKASKKHNVVVSGDDKDTVILANCVYKNVYARKSLTVHHVQRRLNELGYTEANADKDGWFGDLTKSATSKFQKDKGLPATGLMDADTFSKLFQGDPHVEVVL